MILVAHDPVANRRWIPAMILVQALDWIVVVGALAAGGVTLGQVATAPFLPILLILGLAIGYPDLRGLRASGPAPVRHAA